MKKFLATILASLVLVSFGSVFAQVQHDVTVTIPEVVTIRFTDGTSRAPVTTDLDLAFNITGDAADFAGTYPPTNVATRDWADVQVFQNRATAWSVSIAVTPLATGFDWTKVSVTPGSANAIATPFDLGSAGVIAANTYLNAAPRGWNSLGFGPGDFLLTLDGTEDAGTHTATVVYTLTAP
jgi:hypothetical protein